MLISHTIWHDKKTKDKKHNSKGHNATPYVLLATGIWISLKKENKLFSVHNYLYLA